MFIRGYKSKVIKGAINKRGYQKRLNEEQEKPNESATQKKKQVKKEVKVKKTTIKKTPRKTTKKVEVEKSKEV